MNDKQLIDALGGASVVARMIGSKSPQRVNNWKTRGIPPSVKLQHPELFLKQPKKQRLKP